MPLLQSENIQQAIDRIVGAARQPSRVILFGSCARGDAGEHSDLDIMVVEPAVEDRAQEMLRLQKDRRAFQNLNADAGMDLRIVCFHAQQAVEKLLKAVLVGRGMFFRARTIWPIFQKC